MVRSVRLWCVLLLVLIAAAGCGDHGRKATATVSIPSAVPTLAAATASAARTTGSATTEATAAAGPASATASPAATVAAASATQAATAATDGTVAPGAAGSTEPVSFAGDGVSGPVLAVLTDVRAAAHAEQDGWDRIVFEFREALPAGTVSYVDSASACGSGMPIALPGRAVLAVRFQQATAHDDAGRATIAATSLGAAGPSILAARQSCDFEGVVDWAIGVSERKRFTATLLHNPARLVIDVQH